MNPLRQAAVRRKALYFAAIIGLFCVSIFWRGKLPVPFANQVGPSAWLSDRAVRAQAERLELRELDQGDPEVAGAAARLSLIGSRGAVVTGLWWAAIEKQKRNEFHEFELLVRTVTRLQPNFITPWIFQSWNIAYNVSVENDKLGDMYHYIARGIDLLAEGDRVNTKLVRTPDGDRRVGSPDIRYQVGFYYQNKFGVSDKVNTLRSLAQLSCVRPADRRPAALGCRPGSLDPDPELFRKFCESNPQLVRRLRAKLNCTQPKDVVQFLADNDKIPTLYKTDLDLADPEAQFPVLPPEFPEGRDEYHPGKEMGDTFDPFHAARAWFTYAVTVVPPNKRDEEDGNPLPWATPQPGEYDPYRYRVPRAPTLIIFRQQGPRAQSYLAERLGKEGWFDETSGWAPGEAGGTAAGWPDRPLGTPVFSRGEWDRAWQMWDRHGRENGLVLPPDQRQRLEEAAGVRGTPTGLIPMAASDDQLKAAGYDRRKATAHNALVFYDQNRNMTNFAYFLEGSRAEKDQATVDARKLLWEADQARQSAENIRAARLYTKALARWREVLLRYPQFHRAERSDKTEEETYEYELDLARLLKSDRAVRDRAERVREATRALAPAGPETAAEDDYLDAVAADEAAARVTAEAVAQAFAAPAQAGGDEADPARRVTRRVAQVGAAAGALGGVLDAADPASPVREAVVRGVIDAEFPWMKEFKAEPSRTPLGLVDLSAYWVTPHIREAVRNRLGIVRRTTPAAAPAQPTEAAAEAPLPGR